MTRITSGQDLFVTQIARQREAEKVRAMENVGFPSITQNVSQDTNIANAVTGNMQPPLSSQTTTALFSEIEKKVSGDKTLAGLPTAPKTYKYITEDEKNLPEAAKDFLEHARKSPAEKMREAILREEGLTEESLAAMSPEDRAKVEERIAEKIKERMKQEMEKQAGV